MRRILFVSLSLISLGAWARVAENSYEFLSDLRTELDDTDYKRRNEVLKEKSDEIRQAIQELKTNARNDKQIKELEEKLKKLKDEQFLLTELRGHMGMNPEKLTWKWAAGAWSARLPNTPFILTQKLVNGEIVTSISFDSKKSALVVEEADPKIRSFYDRLTLSKEEATEVLKNLNAELTKGNTKIEDAKFDKDTRPEVANKIFVRDGVLHSLGSARKEIDAGIERLSRGPYPEIKEAEDAIKFAKNDRSREERLKEYERMLLLVGKVRGGDLKLNAENEDTCQVLMKASGGYAKMSEAAKKECRDYAPKEVAKDDSDGETKEDKEIAAEKARLSESDSESARRVEMLVRQNMALCEAMAQRATMPLGDQQRRTLGQIVEKVMTNDKVVCGTFNLVMSDVAAENFNAKTGMAGDFKSALDRELGMLEGNMSGPQIEFVGTKAERIVQDYFAAAYQKTSSRGNMRVAQRDLNSKVEAERNQKLMKEKKCLESMASGFASLLQLRQSMEPRDEAEAMAVHQVAHYNSITNMLLKSVNQEIQLTNLSNAGIDMGEPQPLRVPLRSRSVGGAASSVRVQGVPRGDLSPNSQGVGGRNLPVENRRPSQGSGVYGN